MECWLHCANQYVSCISATPLKLYSEYVFYTLRAKLGSFLSLKDLEVEASHTCFSIAAKV